jgi:hypothetical protein
VRAARTDSNHTEIIDALRKVGATVQSLAMVGRGCPDLLVGYRGTNYLLEVKPGDKPPSRRQLTPDEDRWHATWNGAVVVVETTRVALAAIGVRL